MINREIGSTNNAAMIPCNTPATIFSIATSCIATGASSRSSISFVNPKSCTIGNATDCTADSARLSAMIPGNIAAE
jgi:hypothetical protein